MLLLHLARPCVQLQSRNSEVSWQRLPASVLMPCLIPVQLLFYPTAIGSEPQDASLNSYGHWCAPIHIPCRFGRSNALHLPG